MVTRVLVLAVVIAATVSADVVLLPTGIYPTGLAYPPTVVPVVYVISTLPVTTSRESDVDSLVTFTHDIHIAFLEKHNIKAHHHYSFGYECYDWKTRLISGHYASRYGDTAVGTAFRITPEGNRTTVDYTLDPTHGFRASVRKDVQTRPISYGYARMGGPLAYSSLPAPEKYASLKTLLTDEESVRDSNPYVQSAYRLHKLAIQYLHLEAPFNLSWGYEIKDTQTGHTSSQYETYHGDTAEGRYTEVEGDGTETSLDYTVDPRGFTVTTPVEQVRPVAVPVYPGLYF